MARTTQQYQQLSHLHRHSIGVVLEDKKAGSDILIVQPTETLTNISGDLTKNKVKHGEIFATNKIKCVWYNYSDIRDTAPDMVKGEKVEILRYRDTEMYYWLSSGRSKLLRRLEHIQWVLSNTEGLAEKADALNQLFMIASTRDGYLRLTTPANRDEKALWHIIINFADGIISFEDEKSINKWSWDTTTGTINATCKEINWSLGGSSLKANKDGFVLNGNTTINGNVTVNGDVTTKGRTNTKGGITSAGDVKVNNVVKVKGIVKARDFTTL